MPKTRIGDPTTRRRAVWASKKSIYAGTFRIIKSKSAEESYSFASLCACQSGGSLCPVCRLSAASGIPVHLTRIGTPPADARNTVYRALENVRAEKSKFENPCWCAKCTPSKPPPENICRNIRPGRVDTVGFSRDSPEAIGEYDRCTNGIKHEDLPPA